MTHPNSNPVKDAIIGSGVWTFADYVFASGKSANNKMEMPNLLRDPEVTRLVVRSLGELVIKHDPDVLWGVPTGGQVFARIVGEELDLPVIHLQKTPPKHHENRGIKRFKYESAYDERRARQAKRFVGIEDITTEMTSLSGALELPELREKTEAIVAIWRRGGPGVERPLGVEVEWLVEQEVPNMITPDHPLYQQYAHLALGNKPT